MLACCDYLESFATQRALETSRFRRGGSSRRWRNQWRRLLEMLVAGQWRRGTVWVGGVSSDVRASRWLESEAWRGALDEIQRQSVGRVLTVASDARRRHHRLRHRACTPARIIPHTHSSCLLRIFQLYLIKKLFRGTFSPVHFVPFLFYFPFFLSPSLAHFESSYGIWRSAVSSFSGRERPKTHFLRI